MKFGSILIEGQVGTGKTILSRYLAYLNKINQLNDNILKDIERKYLESALIKEISNQDDSLEYIQVHDSMGYEDIVYGLGSEEKEGDINYGFIAKRIKVICDIALNNNDTNFTIILDDFHRNNQDELLRQLKYCITNRNDKIRIAPGIYLEVPDNVLFIFTVCSAEIDNQIKHSNWKFDYIIRLKSNREVLKSAYCGNDEISKTVLAMYDWIKIYLESNRDKNFHFRKDEIMLGHGLFLIPLVDDNEENYLALRNKIDFQILPCLKRLEDKKIIEKDLLLTVKLLSFVNVGKNSANNELVRKVLLKGKERFDTDIEEIKKYYMNEVIPYVSNDPSSYYRYFMETIIDAMLFNGMLPQQLVLGQLLTNPLILKVQGQNGKIASYLLNTKDSKSFTYSSGRTRKGGKRGGRSYYTTGLPKGGRWKEKKDVAIYEVELGDQKAQYMYLSQYSNRSQQKNVREVSLTNTAPIIPLVYQLVEAYLDLYKRECRIANKSEILVKYIEFEQRLLDYYGSELSNYNLFCRRLLNIKLLWGEADSPVKINKSQLDKILCCDKRLDDTTEKQIFENADTIIKFEEIEYMCRMKGYINVMKRLNVHQMILQGPPGTSKTFSAKELILSSLDSPKYEKLLADDELTSDKLRVALEDYKLNDRKYNSLLIENKEGIKELLIGGWDVVQFHPSYSYEDFIRGIAVGFNGPSPNYKQVNRTLGKIANVALFSKEYVIDWNEKHPEEKKEIPKFYLLIDEINRANLSSVLGELIYGLEYRDNPVATPYSVNETIWDTESSDIKSTCSKDIMIPENLYIIGTMNTADRSIDNMDYAIRRRFIFVNCPPNRDIVEKYIPKGDRTKSLELILFDAVQKIFEDTNKYFNVEFQKNDVLIGHTYFIRHNKNDNEAVVEMCDRFVYQVFPILLEYVKDGILNIKNKTNRQYTAEEIKKGKADDLMMNNIVFWLEHYGETLESKVIDDSYIYDQIKSTIVEQV